MKLRLIIAEGIEEKIPFIANKYFPNIPLEQASQVILSLAKADPTPQKKYLEWIARLLSIENIRMPEDGPKILDTLTKFSKSSGINKDINSYKSFGDLAKALDSVSGVSNRELKSKGRSGQLALPNGAKLILEKGHLKVVLITTPKASSILTSGTKWCVANEETAQEYLNEGPLYLIYVDDIRKVLIHFPSGQFMDINDNQIQTQLAESYISLLNKFENIENHPESMWAIRIGSPEKVRRREESPEYIPYMAKHPGLAVKYSRSILNKPWRDTDWPEMEDRIARSVHAITYMESVWADWKPNQKLQRWPAAEHWMIVNSPKQSAEYAINIIKNRWPEAEKTILTDPEATARYAIYAYGVYAGNPHEYRLTGKKARWKEAEPVILQASPYIVADYAVQVIGDRWRQAEPKILTDSYAALRYTRLFRGERWPEAELIILADDYTASIYAIEIKQRIPEIESRLLQNKDLNHAIRYGTAFFKRKYGQDAKSEGWPELKQILLNKLSKAKPGSNSFNSVLSYMQDYACQISNRRWPQFEDAIEKTDAEDLKELDDIIDSYCSKFGLVTKDDYGNWIGFTDKDEIENPYPPRGARYDPYDSRI